MWQFDLPLCILFWYNLRPPRIELGSFAVLLCWGGRVWGGDFSEHKLPLCEIYTPSVTQGDPRETEKRRPRATDTARPSDPARARARGTVPTSLRRRRHHHHLPLSPFAPRRSKRKGKRKRERQPTSRRVWEERWYYFLILIKHRNPHTRRRRRRLSPARSCRWGWSSSSPGRPCARRGP